ncbi:MAG: RNA 2',3'-cyclic phosphodiesterase, partial [Bacteroidia bacterium]|nr:RNA 2',3'-cyclic phosphodiesterase [Bacteroidia bacterium]
TQPDQEFINRLRGLKQALRHDKIKWVEEENMHITIKFFGETEVARIPAIGNVLGAVADSVKEFSFCYEGLGIFGSSYNPRVVWAGIQPYEELSRLMMSLKRELVPLGFPADRQNTVPHLTLGRIRSIHDRSQFQEALDSFKQISSQKMMADNLVLFESILLPSGPEYHKIDSFPLKK